MAFSPTRRSVDWHSAARVICRRPDVREVKIVMWGKKALKDIYEPKKKVVNKNIQNKIDSTIEINADTIDCESTLNPEGQGEALPATDRETCSRGREGLEIHAVVANCARDMDVGAVISDHPP